MLLLATLIIISVAFAIVFSVMLSKIYVVVVPEDHTAITVNKDGFIKRVLPAGRHALRPLERIDFTISTRTALAAGRAFDIATSDGIQTRIHWSGTYALRPDLIADGGRSQRLRGLINAEKAITRNIDINLRRMVGSQMLSDLFMPAVRERLERQLSQLLVDQLRPMGIAFNNLSLQTIELPHEVAEALNKAKAIETLDNTIKQLDPATREVVRGVYQLDEILHWDQYLPVPTRRTMGRLEAASQM